MGKKYLQLTDELIKFIENQHVFFVGTADVDGKVNVSPKGLDSLRVINNNQIIWLNLTGSGNETAAHIQSQSRMTIMFSAFEGNPMILRLYGKAKVVHKLDDGWAQLYSIFDKHVGARQIFVMDIELIQTSCGMAVPLMDFKSDRQQLLNSLDRKGNIGVEQYWAENNQTSLDGKPTKILYKNLGISHED